MQHKRKVQRRCYRETALKGQGPPDSRQIETYAVLMVSDEESKAVETRSAQETVIIDHETQSSRYRNVAICTSIVSVRKMNT